ncbi:MAG: hypothetical protein BWX88_03759 [Planctomycetes bacterium ADurb.Bin126]|nr:MAG: hypothetical protein BWX88_03759 [Planctomycetes bacterium ADurb.Bin126]
MLELEVQARVDVADPDVTVGAGDVPRPLPARRALAALAPHAHHVAGHVGPERDLQADVLQLARGGGRQRQLVVHVPVALQRGSAGEFVAAGPAEGLPDDLSAGPRDHPRRLGVPRELPGLGLDDEAHGGGEDVAAVGIAAVDVGREAALDGGGQSAVGQADPAAEHAGGRAVHLHGREGPEDLVVQADGRVQPSQAGLAPQLTVAGIVDRPRLDVEFQGDLRGRGVGDAHGDRAPVNASRRAGRDLHAHPQGLDLALGHVEGLLERPAEPVGPAHVEAAQGGGGDAAAAGAGQFAEADAHVAEVLPAGPQADLEGVELAAAGLAAQRAPGSGLDPSQGQVVAHADGVAAVLAEQQEGGAGVSGEQGLDLAGRRDHLHRVEAVEVVDGLELDEPGGGQVAGLALADGVGGLLAGGGPGGLGRVGGRQVANAGEIPRALGLEGHVIDEVLARRGGGLEEDVAALARGADGHDVGEAFAGGRVDDEDGLPFGHLVATAPGQVKADDAGLGLDGDAGAGVAPALDGPVGDGIGDVGGGGGGGGQGGPADN